MFCGTAVLTTLTAPDEADVPAAVEGAAKAVLALGNPRVSAVLSDRPSAAMATLERRTVIPRRREGVLAPGLGARSFVARRAVKRIRTNSSLSGVVRSYSTYITGYQADLITEGLIG